MTDTGLAGHVNAIRKFNRFYTKHIGALNAGFLSSPFSLSEVRVLYELAQRKTAAGTALCKELDMDGGQLSRIVRRFEQRNLISKRPSQVDGRQIDLFLTEQGREAFATLNQRQIDGIEAMLQALTPADQHRMVEAMGVIQRVLGDRSQSPSPYILRPYRHGDMGWVVQRHGQLYWQEYGWNEEFEGLVAGITGDFLKNYDPKREHCWIAEHNGVNVGSVFLVKHSETVAKLRLFLVEPSERGQGLGKRLVDECTRFAREAGYRKITLWTNSVLVAARHIYQRAGYRLIESEPYHGFGHDLVGETWELEL